MYTTTYWNGIYSCFNIRLPPYLSLSTEPLQTLWMPSSIYRWDLTYQRTNAMHSNAMLSLIEKIKVDRLDL
jgi:hypothetical protein